MAGESSKKKLEQAALKLFSSRGFYGTTTRAIAALAGVNHALIKHHFGNKEDLWKAAVKAIVLEMETFLADTLQSIQPLEPKMQLELVVRQFVKFSAKHPEIHRIVVFETAEESDRLQWFLDEVFLPQYAPLEMLISSTGNPEMYRYWFYALVGAGSHLYAVHRVFDEAFSDDICADQNVEKFASLMMDMVRKTLPESE